MSKAGYPSGWSPPQERIRFRARRVVTRSSTAIESCLLPALGQPCHLTRRGHVHRHRGGPRGSDPRVIPRPSDCFASSDRSGRSGAVYGIHKSTRQKPECVRVPFGRQGQFRKRVATDGRRWSVPSALKGEVMKGNEASTHPSRRRMDPDGAARLGRFATTPALSRDSAAKRDLLSPRRLASWFRTDD